MPLFSIGSALLFYHQHSLVKQSMYPKDMKKTNDADIRLLLGIAYGRSVVLCAYRLPIT
jgi:hypothetical protein